MEMMILSLNAPAVQAIADAERADEIARKANDFLAEEVAKRPDRFAALAALPMQDPELAARELTRCVKELGFCGALANGFSQVGDADSVALLRPAAILAVLGGAWMSLDVPFYLHPRNPLPGWRRSTRGMAGCSVRPGRSGSRPRRTRCG